MRHRQRDSRRLCRRDRRQTCADEISTALKDAGIVSGLVLADGGMLWCATEMTTKEDIDYLIEMLNIMFFEQDGENETDGGTEA